MKKKIRSSTIKEYKEEIIEFLNSREFKDEWCLMLSKKHLEESDVAYGQVNCETQTIIINPYKNNAVDIIKTIIHEAIHAIHPRLSEYRVRVMHNAVFKDMSPVQISSLLQLAFAHIIWNE
jgi:predicted component of type VI protein secretion system